jgi:hypothetical protein
VSEDEDPVPKLPRGPLIRFAGPQVFRILMTIGMLIAVLVLARPCGNAMSNFIMGFDNTKGSGSGAGKHAPPAAQPQLPGSAGDYVELHPGMTDDEVRQAIEKAKDKAKHAGSAASP